MPLPSPRTRPRRPINGLAFWSPINRNGQETIVQWAGPLTFGDAGKCSRLLPESLAQVLGIIYLTACAARISLLVFFLPYHKSAAYTRLRGPPSMVWSPDS